VYIKENKYVDMDKYIIKLHDDHHYFCKKHNNDDHCEYEYNNKATTNFDNFQQDDHCSCNNHDDCCEEHILVCEHVEKDGCKCNNVKGLNLCEKEVEVKYFKHCSPISQPCDCIYYNHFISRTNLEFNGLFVVKNTGNSSKGCLMKVCVTDKNGTAVVAIVNPGSSVPIFVEGLMSVEIACLMQKENMSCPLLCVGEIIFDLEYCSSKYVETRCEDSC